MGKKSKGKGKKRDRGFEGARVGTADWADGTSWTGATRSEAGAAAATEAGATADGATGDGAIGDGPAGPGTTRLSAPGRPTFDTSPGPRLATRGPGADANELAARLASLSTVLLRHLSRADTGDGLTRARLSALALLVLGGPRTLGDLAAAEHVRPPTMTRLVHAMEADGLVVRERNPADGRSVIIRASATGEAKLALGRARQIAPLAESIAELAAAERRQLEAAADLLGRVLREASWEAIEAEA
jgi:DNA-binding MarR family transcriptional regulator